jgi:hypothetical protein
MQKSWVIPLLCALTACGGGTSVPAGSATVCPVAIALGDLNYPAASATNVVDSQNIVVVSGGVATGALNLSSASAPT